MIHIDIINDRFAVVLDANHPRYQDVFILVEYLLSSYQFDKNAWYLDYSDIGFLRKKLDMLGLIEGRTVSQHALNRLEWIHSIHVKNEALKNGVYNEEVLRRLEGNLKTDLYEDQVPAVGVLLENRRWGLFDAMGSGKTICSLAAVSGLPEVRKTLVICPKNVLFGFEREIRSSTYLKPIVVPAGRAKALEFIRDSRDGDWDIMLVHPENLITTTQKKEKKVFYGDIYRVLESMIWDMIIVDEFHMYKDLGRKRTKCLVGLLTNTRDHEGNWPRAIALTGTPISESPMNAYNLLAVFGYSYLPNPIAFENYFCIKELKEVNDRSKKPLPNGKYPKKGFMEVTGFRNLHELKTRIERISIRRSKADMKGFPDQTFQVREVHLKGKQLKLYKAVLTKIVKDLPINTVINIYKFLTEDSRTLRLRQIMNHPGVLNEEGESAKYEEIDRILEELFADPEQKVVIWTEYRKAVELLEDRYKYQYGAVKLYGGVDIDPNLVQRFEYDASCRVIVSIPSKAGMGTDFLARARTALYVDRPYSYVFYNQSIDRIHRRAKLGKLTRLDEIRAQPATIMFLDVVNSVDTLVRDKLMVKGDLVDALTIPDQKLLEMGRKDLLRYLK